MHFEHGSADLESDDRSVVSERVASAPYKHRVHQGIHALFKCHRASLEHRLGRGNGAGVPPGTRISVAWERVCSRRQLRSAQTSGRSVRIRSSTTPKQALDAQIFIDIRPMDTFSIAQQLPILALLRSCIQETRVPRERDAQGAPIRQDDRQLVIAEPHILSAGNSVIQRSGHSRHPSRPAASPQL